MVDDILCISSNTWECMGFPFDKFERNPPLLEQNEIKFLNNSIK